MKIAILGGAFDPITTGHIDIANYLVDNNIVDEVWLSPCYLSYYDKKMADSKHRLEMCSLAVSDNKNIRIKVTDFEIKNKLIGESVDILASFIKYYPMHQLYFVIGMDNAIKINTWTGWTKLINMLPFIIFPREDNIMPKDAWFLNKPHIYMDRYKENLISSTIVRNNIKNNVPPEYISSSVQTYISQHGVYMSHILYLYNIRHTNSSLYKLAVLDKNTNVEHIKYNIVFSTYVNNKLVINDVVARFLKLFTSRPDIGVNVFDGDSNDMIYELMETLNLYHKFINL